MAKMPPDETILKEIALRALTETKYKGKTIQEWVDILSASDLAEVAPARWIVRFFPDGSKGYRCSNCGLTEEVGTPYCPFCGAKMDGGAGV
jgi:hypothetical protein